MIALRKKLVIYALIAIGALTLTMGIFLVCHSGRIPITQYESMMLTQIRQEVAGNPLYYEELAAYAEKRHGTVSVRHIEVVKVDVETSDGEDFVLKDGSNLLGATVSLRLLWDGVFHKNGHTDLFLVYDGQGNRLRISVPESTGLVDLPAIEKTADGTKTLVKTAWRDMKHGAGKAWGGAKRTASKMKSKVSDFASSDNLKIGGKSELPTSGTQNNDDTDNNPSAATNRNAKSENNPGK